MNRQTTGTDPNLDLQGHRGCRGLLPENTLPAMLKAIDLGVTTLEMDVVITADSQVILSHEPFFNHEIATHPDGRPVTEAEEKSLNIFRMTYAETLRFDVGARRHPRFPEQQPVPAQKPLLADLVDSVEAYAARKGRTLYYNIETKSTPATDGVYHPGPEVFTQLLLSVLRQKGILARTIIQSFDPRTLQVVHSRQPGVKTSLLVEDYDTADLEVHLAQLGFTPFAYSPFYGHVNSRLVAQCREKGMQLIPWTVNTLEEMKKLKAVGVDGLISDYPNLYAQL